ncbi:hypothetical protein FRC03_005302 [Tulasnella sp. 419]|nr:hypothetical protein FRC03_005302 [Tulasnella sp. 419]
MNRGPPRKIRRTGEAVKVEREAVEIRREFVKMDAEYTGDLIRSLRKIERHRNARTVEEELSSLRKTQAASS